MNTITQEQSNQIFSKVDRDISIKPWDVRLHRFASAAIEWYIEQQETQMDEKSRTLDWFAGYHAAHKALATDVAPTTVNIVMDSYNQMAAMKETAKATSKVSNELTQLGLQELYAFQEATGFDTAAEFGANYSNYKLLLEAVTFIAYVNAMDYEYQEVAKIALRKICQN